MRDYHVLYVQLPATSVEENDRVETACENLTLFCLAKVPRLRRRLTRCLPLVQDLNGRFLCRKIERVIAELGYDNALLVSFQHDFPQIMRSRKFSKTVYLCNDDFPAMVRPWERPLARWLEGRVAKSADIVIAVSTPLVQSLRRYRELVHLLLPGQEFPVRLWEREDGECTMCPRTGPLQVAFMGYINRRIESGWIERLLTEEDITLTMIGPVEDQALIESFLGRSNFVHREPQVGDQLFQSLREQNVLIMPYHTNGVGAKATSAPNKLFQYLAAGKPVVISDMPSFIDLPDGFVYRASSAEGFVQAVRRAAAEDNLKLRNARVRLAAEHSWDRQGDRLLQLLRDPA